MIGPLEGKFLADFCGIVQSDLDLNDSAIYSKTGNFAKNITVVSRA
ncbi:hypothetical protein NVIE_019410 [Nitrososphaera viennensis EN76]|uniref:Uncharacterized protein n=1 Tax=Nitrososphaera viennensis EN76 TaxID=926571 RepID=A0A060HHX6_9ARCH|nr:hypothetical protein NVIE_019410 [Nitrososphaera viennensis EN76]